MRYILCLSFVLIAGCDQIRSTKDRLFQKPPAESTVVDSETSPIQEEPVAEPTAEASAEPVASNPGWEGSKSTIAGLGDPTKAGRWMETPIVSSEINGRVVARKTGATAYVTLIPSGGAPTSGSHLSLDAMRALLAPLDELVELDVYSN